MLSIVKILWHAEFWCLKYLVQQYTLTDNIRLRVNNFYKCVRGFTLGILIIIIE